MVLLFNNLQVSVGDCSWFLVTEMYFVDISCHCSSVKSLMGRFSLFLQKTLDACVLCVCVVKKPYPLYSLRSLVWRDVLYALAFKAHNVVRGRFERLPHHHSTRGRYSDMKMVVNLCSLRPSLLPGNSVLVLDDACLLVAMWSIPIICHREAYLTSVLIKFKQKSISHLCLLFSHILIMLPAHFHLASYSLLLWPSTLIVHCCSFLILVSWFIV